MRRRSRGCRRPSWLAALAALTLLLAPPAASARVDTLADRDSLTHGIAGDERHVFVTEPGVGIAANGARVVALDRFSGEEVAAFPAPPGGFKLPFTLRVPRTGHLVVLDSGGFPPMGPPVVYDYRYKSDRRGLRATLERATDFKGLPLAFAEDVEVLPNGEYVVSESIAGGLWLIGRDGEIRRGLVPDDGAPPLPKLGACPFAGTGTVGGLPFAAPGGFAPGAGSLAVRGGNLYVSSTCEGGVQRLPIRVLLDGSRPAAERAKRIVTVTPRKNPLESLKGIAFNRWDRGDPWLYAGDPFSLQLVRIHSRSGRREVLSTDARMFNFTVATAFLPPRRRGGPNPLVTASDQEHRWSATNAALTASTPSSCPSSSRSTGRRSEQLLDRRGQPVVIAHRLPAGGARRSPASPPRPSRPPVRAARRARQRARTASRPGPPPRACRPLPPPRTARPLLTSARSAARGGEMRDTSGSSALRLDAQAPCQEAVKEACRASAAT